MNIVLCPKSLNFTWLQFLIWNLSGTLFKVNFKKLLLEGKVLNHDALCAQRAELHLILNLNK